MKEEIQSTIEQLRQGKVILYPTDTIWGLGCDPANQEAVDRIFKIKNREKSKPLIILVDSIERLKELIPPMHPHLENILYYNERPLTIIFNHATKRWADGVTGNKGSIAIRIVKDAFCKAVIEGLDSPIVSTSANISHEPFPRNYHEINPKILDEVDYIVSIHQNDKNAKEVQPSLIAKYSIQQKELVFLRQ